MSEADENTDDVMDVEAQVKSRKRPRDSDEESGSEFEEFEDISTEGEDDESEESESGSEEDDESEKTKWLDFEEYHKSSNLIRLLNGTSRRPKTIDNYVAPNDFRNMTVRSVDVINGFDCKSGVWINGAGKICLEDARSGIYKTKPQKTKKPKSEEPSLVKEPKKKLAKMEKDFKDVSQSDESSSSESDWEAELDDIEGDGEDEKKNILLQDLQELSGADHYNLYKQSKDKQARARILMDATQIVVDGWDKIKRQFGKRLKMKFDSSLHCENPQFTMEFIRPSHVPVRASFDCQDLILRCQCMDTFANTEQLVAHITESH